MYHKPVPEIPALRSLDTGGSEVQGHAQLHSEFISCLGYVETLVPRLYPFTLKKENPGQWVGVVGRH